MRDGGRRQLLATGIYRDQYGITVRVSKGSGPHKVTREARFPLGTPLEQLRSSRRDLNDDLRGAVVLPTRAPRPGTLAEDIAAYLATFPETSAHHRDEAALLKHWLDAGVGNIHRDALTPILIKQQLACWAALMKIGPDGKTREPRFTPATLNHLRRVLGAVYRAVNGQSGFNPVRDVPKLTVRYEEPRAISYELIEFILAHVPDIGASVRGTAKKDGGDGRSTINKGKLRLRVMAYTGLPQAQLARVQPRDLNLRQQQIFARPRRKGAGVDGYYLPLTDEGMREFREFARQQCFGPFRSRALARTWRAAVSRAKTAWLARHRTWPLPDDVRAYDLRHSFATRLYLHTGDLQATGDLLMHASLTTTRRYTKAAVTPRMRQAVAAWSDGRKDGSLGK